MTQEETLTFPKTAKKNLDTGPETSHKTLTS